MKFPVVGIMLAICVMTCPGLARSEWYSYTTGDGLADDEVHAILVDRAGNIWFGGGYGVTRYDGVTWQVFMTLDDGMAVTAEDIEQDQSGNIWFATSIGVIRYDGVTWRTYTAADGLVEAAVSEIAVDHSGNIWAAYGGVSMFDGTTWHAYTTAEGLPNNAVTAIGVDQAGNVWFGTSMATVTRYDGVSWRTFSTADGLPGQFVEVIECDHLGNVWVGTEDGLARYDGKTWRTYRTAGNVPLSAVVAIAEDHYGNMWFGSVGGLGGVGGLSRFDGAVWRTYTIADGLSGSGVSSIAEDHLGNIWAGTWLGASRFDGATWRWYTTADGLSSNQVKAGLEDHAGNLWFATYDGVSRFDGATWRAFTTADGLPSSEINAIIEDRSGNLWVGTYRGGASRFDGTSWRTYTTADGLAGNTVWDITEDRHGNLWFATDVGVSRYDGANWRTLTTNPTFHILEDHAGDLWFSQQTPPDMRSTLTRFDGVSWYTYTEADGFTSRYVYSILEDRHGNIWVGTYDDGVCRYDGVRWHTYTKADGLLENEVWSIAEDRVGNLWFGHGSGVSRYDGVGFGTYFSLGGISGYRVGDIVVDRYGTLWFATYQNGVIRHDQDLVAPETAIPLMPPRLSASTTQNIGFTSAYNDLKRITYSYSFDGSPWSGWSSINFWSGAELPDGEHVFKVRARDEIGNVDTTAAVCLFEIDSAPPVPVVTFPRSGEPVRDSVGIRGTASDPRFKKYRVEVSRSGAGAWELLAESTLPVIDGTLCWWETSALPDGSYDLRFSVTDTLGLTGIALLSVVVDNHAPWAYETAPAMVSVASGGHVYTTDGEVRLYFPPRAFAREAGVEIVGLAESAVPDTLENGALRVIAGYEISWGGVLLEKPATLEISYAGWESVGAGEALMQAPAYAMPALYMVGADSTWRRVGGTVDERAERVSAAITEPGRYALFLEPPGTGGTGAITLSPLSLTPRVFAPNGAFANDHVAIGFTLGRSAPVTVKVYNRAGRLVREVVSGETMGAGANLVRWDGRDVDAGLAGDGLYLIVVDALGQKQSKTIAVVR